MIKEQINKLDKAVKHFAAGIASLDRKIFLKKMNRWSPRDIIIHLIGWNRYIIEGSKQIIKGELPFYDIDPGQDYSKVNAVIIRENPSFDRQKLLNELQQSKLELKHFLLSIDVSDWDRDFGVKHNGLTITVKNTVDELIDDYIHHQKQIEALGKGSI